MSTYDEQLAELMEFGRTLDQVPTPGSQGSADWHRARIGKATASRFADAIDFRKDRKESAKRYGYRMELVVERLTGEPSEHYVSEYMEWGSEQEAAARMAYEAATGNLVIVPGFVDHPTIPMCGGSPDGLVDDDGIIEMKAPTSKTHIETLLSEECEHLPQIMGNLACTQRKWCDFVSYDPRLPKHLQLYIRRVFADGKYIETLESGVMVFLNETAELMARLNETAPGQSAETATPATDDSSREAAASEAALHHEMKHAIVRAPSGQSERQGCRREAS